MVVALKLPPIMNNICKILLFMADMNPTCICKKLHRRTALWCCHVGIQGWRQSTLPTGGQNHRKVNKVQYVDVLCTFNLKISNLCGCLLSGSILIRIFSLKPHVCLLCCCGILKWPWNEFMKKRNYSRDICLTVKNVFAVTSLMLVSSTRRRHNAAATTGSTYCTPLMAKFVSYFTDFVLYKYTGYMISLLLGY